MPLKQQPASLFASAVKSIFQYIRDLHAPLVNSQHGINQSIYRSYPGNDVDIFHHYDDQYFDDPKNNDYRDDYGYVYGTSHSWINSLRVIFQWAPRLFTMCSGSDIVDDDDDPYTECRICDGIQHIISCAIGPVLSNQILQKYLSRYHSHDIITPCMLRLFLGTATKTVNLKLLTSNMNTCINVILAKNVELNHLQAFFDGAKCAEKLIQQQTQLTSLSLTYGENTQFEYVLYLIGTHLSKLQHLSIHEKYIYSRRASKRNQGKAFNRKANNAFMYLVPDPSIGRPGCVLLKTLSYFHFSWEHTCLITLFRELPNLVEISSSSQLFKIFCETPASVSSAVSLKAIDISANLEDVDMQIIHALGKQVEAVQLRFYYVQTSNRQKLKSVLSCFSRLKKFKLGVYSLHGEDLQDFLYNSGSTLTYIGLFCLENSNVLPIIVQNCHSLRDLDLHGGWFGRPSISSPEYGASQDTVSYPLIHLETLDIASLDQSCSAKWIKSILGSPNLRKINFWSCGLVTSHVLRSIIHAMDDTNHMFCNLETVDVSLCKFVDHSVFLELLDADHIPLRELTVVKNGRMAEEDKRELRHMVRDRQLDLTLVLQ